MMLKTIEHAGFVFGRAFMRSYLDEAARLLEPQPHWEVRREGAVTIARYVRPRRRPRRKQGRSK